MTIDEQAWKEEFGRGFQAGFQAGLDKELQKVFLRDSVLFACMFEQALRHKFGPLSPELVDRIARADSDTLEGWVERFWTADTIDAVFGD